MTGQGESWVVRVRIPRANAWPSKPMTRGEAIALASSLRDLIRDEGDAAGFVEFEAHGGRVVHVRAREVLSVEVDQWRSRPAEAVPAAEGLDRVPPPQPFSPSTMDGTAFLQRQAQTVGRSPR